MATSNPNILERLQLARTPKAKPEKKGMVRRGEKLKEEYKGYKKQLTVFLAKEENQVCQIKAKGCTGLATAVHHLAGRTGTQLKNEADWIPCCVHCNLSVEIFDAEAREKGFKKTRLGKVNKVTK